MIDALRTLAEIVRALPSLPLRVAQLEMSVRDLEHDADRTDAVLSELYVGPRRSAAA